MTTDIRRSAVYWSASEQLLFGAHPAKDPMRYPAESTAALLAEIRCERPGETRPGIAFLPKRQRLYRVGAQPFRIRRPITGWERKRILALRVRGWGFWRIGRLVGRSGKTIERFCKRMEQRRRKAAA